MVPHSNLDIVRWKSASLYGAPGDMMGPVGGFALIASEVALPLFGQLPVDGPAQLLIALLLSRLGCSKR
jgi:hypothetical protein